MKRTLITAAFSVALAVTLFAGAALFARPSERASESDRAPIGVPVDLLIGAEDVDSTIEALEQRIDRDGTLPAASYASLAFGYLQKARNEAAPALYDKAEEALSSSFEVQPEGNFEATLGTAILAGSRHDFHGQLRWARRAVEVNPHNSQALGTVGDAYLELGDNEPALKVYQKMVDLRPDLPSLGRISYAAQVQGDTTGAIAAMERALSFAGTSRQDAAWAHWQLAELHIGNQSLNRAATHLDRALGLNPGFGPALESSAHLAAARGDIETAIEILEALVVNFPLPGNFAFLGELHLLTGEDEAARAAFDEADARLQGYAAHEVRTDVDYITFWADRKIHVEKALEEAQILYSERSSAAVSDALARALFANGDLKEARRYAREAIRRSVDDAGYHYHAGMIERALGHRERSRDLLAEALELDPSWSIFESHRARTILGTHDLADH